jgi:phage baseplate assembly protein V
MNDVILRIYRSIMLAFGRGRITFVDDSGSAQKVQARFGPLEVIDNLPLPHDFGFTSNPPTGSDVFASFLGGNRKNGIIVTVGNQTYRMRNLASGETAIYDSRGQSIYLTKNGIVVESAGLPITINNTPKVTINASAEIDFNTPLLKVTGDIIDQSGTNSRTMAEMRQIFNEHDHPVSGVQSGSSTVTSDAPNQLQ